MKIKFLGGEYSICQVKELADFDMTGELFFLAKTPDEVSVVCPAGSEPAGALKTDRDWRAFRIEGLLDFSLVGILSSISKVLASNGISIFAVSTFDTDYILVKKDKVEAAKEALGGAGYEILQ